MKIKFFILLMVPGASWMSNLENKRGAPGDEPEMVDLEHRLEEPLPVLTRYLVIQIL